MKRAFTQEDLTVSVEASEQDLAWLSEFLSPAFRAATSTTAQAQIHLEPGLDDDRGDRSAPAPVAFAFDSGPVRLPSSRIAGGLRLHNRHWPIDLDVTADGRRVRVRHDQHVGDARVSVMRVIREYAHNRWIQGGGLVLHAAAIVADGAAIAIAGAKGAGKTTLALRLLGLAGVDYLSNDRVLVRPSEPFPSARPVPTIVSLREGTRRLLPELARRLAGCGDYRETAQRRASTAPSMPVNDDGTWRVSPAQLCAALERNASPGAPLAAVLFPEEGVGRPRRLVRRLDAEAAGGLLEQATLCGGSGVYTSEVFVTAREAPPDPAEIRRRCGMLASRVACFAFTLPDSASTEDARALIERCLARR